MTQDNQKSARSSAGTVDIAEGSSDACPACGGSDFRYLFKKGGKDFWRCRTCGLERQWPLPTLAELAAYYERSYSDGMYQAFTAADEMKRLTAVARFRQVVPPCRVGRWLDVGCSNGVFLEEAVKHGADAEGVELSDVAADQARGKGLRVTTGTLDEIPPEPRFDTITAFDVLEHVLEPLTFVTAIRERLVDGGKMALTVPNLRSFSRMIMGRRWYFYIPEEHLHYFAPAILRRLLERAGFEVETTRSTYKPLTFDYSMVQFQEYNPWIYGPMSLAAKIIPRTLREKPVPLRIGETLAIARKR